MAKSKKYQSMATTGLDCLNCTFPTHVCCGVPKQCRARYEKYLEKKAKDERKRKVPKLRRKKDERISG